MITKAQSKSLLEETQKLATEINKADMQEKKTQEPTALSDTVITKVQYQRLLEEYRS